MPITIVQSKKEIKYRALCEYIRGVESKSNDKRFVIPLLFAVSLVSSYRKYVCNVHFCHSSVSNCGYVRYYIEIYTKAMNEYSHKAGK